jgi:hypothetical protein
VSQSGSQAAAFFRDLARHRQVWCLRDDRGSSAPKTDSGVGAAVASVAAGATPVAAPVARDWGGRSAYIADPEGNRWEIAWAACAVFDERGAVVSFG